MERYAQNFLQSTADLSISAQEYLWSIFGIRTAAELRNSGNTNSSLINKLRESSAIEYKKYFTVCGTQIEMGSLARRIAGLSGAAAVAMAGFSAHRVLVDQSIDERRKKAVDNANKHHFLHTLAILFAPHARFPLLTVGLFSAGILLFCGSCYAYGIWNNDKMRAVSPLGGLMLILGWLSFVL